MNFYLKCILMGVSLATDASVVSLANGLKYPQMKWKYRIGMCFSFGFFGAFFPLLGYGIGATIFSSISAYIPWLSFVIFLLLGINMFFESFQPPQEVHTLKSSSILLQAITTSIDAFTVGFSLVNLTICRAISFVGIVGGITCLFCFLGVKFGRYIGLKFGRFAEAFGGIILIYLGIEMLLKGV